MKTKEQDSMDANRDPITDAPGAHPIGTGLGAAAGGMAAGALVGTVAGPIGTVVGAAAGALLGGLSGSAVGEAVNPTEEDAYWAAYYGSEPYYQTGYTFDDYSPAYRVGYTARNTYPGKTFKEIERELEADYLRAKGQSRLAWIDARNAAQAAYQRGLTR